MKLRFQADWFSTRNLPQAPDGFAQQLNRSLAVGLDYTPVTCPWCSTRCEGSILFSGHHWCSNCLMYLGAQKLPRPPQRVSVRSCKHTACRYSTTDLTAVVCTLCGSPLVDGTLSP